MARRLLLILLSILAIVLLGITLLLSSIHFFLAIDDQAFLTQDDIPWPDPPYNASIPPPPGEVVPRIIHQTWKDEILPERWRGVSQGCRDLMPDYEYILWTDASSRDFLAEHYAWFIPTFDAYRYPIQRADAIRYFVLYHYGGAYLDLDVGCQRRLDPLLRYPVTLPITVPVGVSNDLMLAAPRHPFMRGAIDGLQNFDHDYLMNYPTVMFSTGPMFLSAQYGLYTSSSSYPETPADEVRVLPKSLYGKNAKPGEAPHAFFTHYYGSSWHADDAGFVLFLGNYGRLIMYFGGVVVVLGAARMLLNKLRPSRSHEGGRWRRLGRYDVFMPRVYQDERGRHRIDLGVFSLSSSTSATPTSPTPASPYTSTPPSPTTSSPILPLTLEHHVERAPSPISALEPETPINARRDALRWAITIPSRMLSSLSSPLSASSPSYLPLSNSPSSHIAPPDKTPHRSRRRGVMFFLPAIFHPSTPRSHSHSRSRSRSRDPSRTRTHRDSSHDDLGIPLSAASDAPLLPPSPLSPPPYTPDLPASYKAR